MYCHEIRNITSFWAKAHLVLPPNVLTDRYMRLIRILTDRLSYSNVMATVALLAALGGGAYATTSLPARSVGPIQLRKGAVTPGALGFPLGVQSNVSQSPIGLTKKPGCNAPMPPGAVNHVFCPAMTVARTGSAASVHVHLLTAGKLLISAMAGLRDEDAAATSAGVTISIVVDGRVVQHQVDRLFGGQSVQVPAQMTVGATRGPHTVGLTMAATYSNYGPGEVIVAPVSVTVTMFPQ
jgi:hypothetical protein